MVALRHFWHLVTRFIGVVTSRPLGPRAQESVTEALTNREAALFWQQQPIDQRHAFEVATKVAAEVGEVRSAVAAALLHDVGKYRSRLGAIERSLATVFSFAGLPMPRRWADYRNHGTIGAMQLQKIDADPLAVAFARGEPTTETDPEIWRTLTAADNGSGLRIRRRVSAVEGGKAPAKDAAGNTMPPEVTT